MPPLSLYPIHLRLFDGDAPAAAPSGASAPDSPEEVNKKSAKSSVTSPSTVKYGLQTEQPNDAALSQPEPPGEGLITGPDNPAQLSAQVQDPVSPDDRNAQFQKLISNDFPDLFQQELNAHFTRQQSVIANLQNQLSQAQNVLNVLASRYGLDPANLSDLTNALDNDSAFWSLAAEEAGMPVEMFRRLRKAESELSALKNHQCQEAAANKARQDVQRWLQEGNALKQKFPDFDINTESKNQQFVDMVNKGVPMEHAYKVLHIDQIVGDAMKTAAASAEKKVSDHVRASASRPSENGAAQGAPFTVKADVHSLSRKDRAEIAKRVARGETIRF